MIIRKKRGNFLEDFWVGQLFRHKVGKTVTEGLFNAFTEFGMTTNPLSKNLRYAQRYGFKGLIAPPGLVMNIVFSQSVEDISENARANLEYRDVRFGASVYIGDTIEVETTIVGVQPSSKEPDRGVVHVQTTGRNQHGEIVLTLQRKVQIWKDNQDAKVEAVALAEVPQIPCTLQVPAYEASRNYRELAHLTNPDTYFEDFNAGDVLEHSRGRTVTTVHMELTAMLDNTSQVHSNQYLVDQNPSKYIGGQLIVYGGIPFNLCLGLSCPDVGDNVIGDVCYITGRHTGPVFVGDTVFASTEIKDKREYPGRPDLGIISTNLRGHKFVKKGEACEKMEIFYLEREMAVKRRSHYV
ncbi:MAG: MaoC family dehydratase [Deltaproteobacteria bacterium]|nr:MaoC family dehydratase [Deltaproteobacteria bacterium]